MSRHPREGEVYECHKRGAHYQIISVAEDVDTADLYVIYKRVPRDGKEEIDEREVNKLWARSMSQFIGQVEFEGQMVKRFKRVE